MSSIDQRVVEMKLDNKQFESGVSSTMSALDKLKAALRFDGAKKNMSDLNAASRGINLDHIGFSVDKIREKFSALSVAGIAALGALSTKIASFGLSQLGNITEPLQAGFAEYELKMGSIQTIMANTARHGTKLKTVTNELQALNEYADNTIYSFSDMTRNASLFTNAGIKIEDATTAIKGFSNAAAASGVGATQAAGAAYQLTQAMNAGVVRLMDWRSLTNAGMGSKNMQEGLIQVAGAMGTFNENTTDANDATKDFNGSLEKEWLTADVMSNYLKIMSGDMKDAEMAAMGLSKAEIKSLRRAAEDAYDAATKVRTFTQLVSTLKEGIGSGWATSIELLVGDFDQATELWSGISNTLGEMIGKQADARNKMIKQFVKAGGRDDIIEGFGNLWEAAMAVIKPIQKAFNEIFPKKSGKELTVYTRAFVKFTEVVKMGAEGVGKLAPLLKLILVPIKIIGTTLKAVIGILAAGLSVVGAFVLGIFKLVGMMATAGFGFAKLIANSEAAQRIFKALKDIVDAIVGSFKSIADALMKFGIGLEAAFQNFRFGYIQQAILGLQHAFMALGIPADKAMEMSNRIVHGLRWIVQGFRDLRAGVNDAMVLKKLSIGFANLGIPMDKSREALTKIIDIFRNFKSIGDSVASGVEFIGDKFKSLRGSLDIGSGINTDKIQTATIESDKFRGVWEVIGKIAKGAGQFFGELFGGLADFLATATGKIADYIKTLSFQEILALINTGLFITMYTFITRMANTFSGLGKSFSETLGSIGDAIENFGKKETVADKILKIAIAIGVLAASAWVLASIDVNNLVKALVAIAVMMTQLAITMKIMSKIEFAEDSQIMKATVALAIMAVAILILATAVKKFEGLSWQDFAKGLIGVVVLLGALALFTKFAAMDAGSSIRSAAALVVMAIAIRLLAGAVERFGTMDTGVLQKGLLVVGLLLAAFAGMSYLLNGAQLMSAATGLLILSGALIVLSLTLRYYAGLDWEMLVDGLQKMAAVLITVGLSARALPGNLPITAIGLVILAGAILVLTGALAAVGLLPIEVIIKGLSAIVILIGTIALAMRLMADPKVLLGAVAVGVVAGSLYLLVPLLIALGSLPWEVVLLGLGALAGVFLILGVAGLVLGPVIPVLIALAAVIAALGIAAMLVGAGMFLFGAGFAAMTGAVIAGGAVILSALQSLIMMIPLFMQQLALGIIAFAVVIRDAGPPIVDAITTVLISILLAIQRAAPEAGRTFAVLIMTIVNTVTALAPMIVDRFMIMLLRILTTMRIYVPQIVEQALLLMHDFLATVADNIGPIVDEATRLMVEFMDGIERNIPELVESGERMVRTFIREVGAALLGGVGDMVDDGAELAGGIVSGMVSGIANGIASVTQAARDLASNALQAAKDFLGMKSPSKKFKEVGRYSDEGMAIGMYDYASEVTDAATFVGKEAIFAMKKTISRLPELVEDLDANPRITPVLDLSQVNASARGLNSMLSPDPIKVDASYRGATAAESGYWSNREAALELAEAAREEAAKIEFNQYNTSPKPLDRVEIYRQTNNQLSLLREEFNAAPR